MYDERRKKKSSFFSLIHIHRLEKREKRLSMYALSSNQPMKKWSAQPTGNGKEIIIIIITTLLPFRMSASGAVGKKTKKKKNLLFLFFSILRFLLCKKEMRETNIFSNIDLSCW
jgi:hypothetical protein